MSNYRVRQVLALDPMPDRELRFLLALATYMDDDSRNVKVGFSALTEATGRSADTARRGRKGNQKAGRISYLPGRGRGHLTTWTVLCLPQKGGNNGAPFSADVKGVQPGSEKGGNHADKRGATNHPDQQEPKHWLIRMAKSSLSLPRALAELATVVPSLTERDITAISHQLTDNPDVRHPAAYLRSLLSNGEAAEWAATVLSGSGAARNGHAHEQSGPRSEACRQSSHKPWECGYGDEWCTCTCHNRGRKRRDQGTEPEDPRPLGALIGEMPS